MRWLAAIIVMASLWTPIFVAAGTPASSTRAITAAGGAQQAAREDAAVALSLLRLPAGAQRAPDNPAADPAALASPGAGSPATPNLVAQTSFWRVPGAPQQVIAWIERHRPLATRILSEGSAGKGTTPAVWSVAFARKPVRGVLWLRQLGVTVAAAAGGGTALRADGQDVWEVPRPASETVPARVSRVEVSLPGTRKPVDVLDRARIATLRRLFNRLPLVQPGAMSCPLDRGERIVLTFHGAAPATRATVDVGGCATVHVTLGGAAQLPLAGFGIVDDLEAIIGRTLTGALVPPPPLRVVRIAAGRLEPGGGSFQLSAYRDVRLGVCAQLDIAGVDRGTVCQAGKRRTAGVALACYPRQVSAFLALGGKTTALYDDDTQVDGRSFRLPPSLGGGKLALGFRQGVHDLDRIRIGKTSLPMYFGPFAQC